MVELLSPVGNMKTLYSAIAGGADAVYFAGKSFGARAFAQNFDNDEIVEAIKFCHLHGVKAYVTVNTIIYQDEVEEVMEFIKFLYLNNVDALIMQDLGMIKLAKERYPNLEIHASTQCHVHNKETALALSKIGVSRVVFARELDLDTIKNMDINVEKEVFIHGALCVSYSGCCLFSSLNGGRSANRGECVGSCRLPYKLIENDKVIKTNGNYLLSTRELNTIEKINELLDNNIKCLKIEGRMKSPEYVGYITRIYRKAINNYYNNKNINISKEELTNMATLYNRKFSSGYLFNDKIINIDSPNHQGSYLGKVIEVNKKRIKIKLDNVLNQEDGIRFQKSNLGMIVNKLYNDKGLLINKAKKEDIVEVDNKIGLNVKDIVNKTFDIKINKEVDKLEYPKIPININVTAKIGKPLKIEFADFTNKVSMEFEKVEKSINNPTTENEICEKLSKLGNSVYTLNKFYINKDDNIFINLTTLNNARRMLVELLNNKRIELKYDPVINEVNEKKYSNKKIDNININVLVRNEEQLKVCLDNNVNNIYVTDYNLYLKYKDNKNIYYQTTRVNPKLLDLKNENILATELSSIVHYAKDNNVISDYYLNVVNNDSIKYLSNLNVKRITLSLELDDNRLKLLNHNNTEIIIYGRACLMICKYCVLKECLNNCKNCYNNQNKYYLEDRFKNRYPITHDNCITSIMDYKVIDKIDNINFYKEIGISNYRLELFAETKKEIQKLLNKINEIK